MAVAVILVAVLYSNEIVPSAKLNNFISIEFKRNVFQRRQLKSKPYFGSAIFSFKLFEP